MIELKCIKLQVDVDNADEGIEYAGEILEREGFINPTYTAAMISNYHKNGPYFSIAPHFAMPHARPEDGVLKAGVSLITLKNPLTFGNSNDPIKVILALATSSNDEHLSYMMKVAAVLGQDNIIEKIYESTSPEEVQSYFKIN